MSKSSRALAALTVRVGMFARERERGSRPAGRLQKGPPIERGGERDPLYGSARPCSGAERFDRRCNRRMVLALRMDEDQGRSAGRLAGQGVGSGRVPG